MSRKSEEKKLRREMRQAGLRQALASYAADKAAVVQPRLDGRTDFVFRATWPEGAPGSFADVDLSKFGFDCVQRTAEGRLALRFPEPYDILITDGEELTLSKARQVHEAAAALGILTVS